MVNVNNPINENVSVSTSEHDDELPRRYNQRRSGIQRPKLRALSYLPVIELPSQDHLDQIKSFFNSPVPKLSFANDDLQGVFLEWNLRKLLEDTTAYEFNNLIGTEQVPNKEIQYLESIYYNTPTKEKPNPMVGLTLPWGTFANKMARKWDRTIEELVEKKIFLKKGLYATDDQTRISAYYSDINFELKFPDFNNMETKAFELPLPIKYFIEEAGGLRNIVRSHVNDSEPSKYSMLSRNIFVDRKANKGISPICQCTPPPPGKGGCLSQCLNRCMYFECGDNCPSGSQCTNRMYQAGKQNDFADKINVTRFDGRGFGLTSTVTIPADSFILEYRGEVINNETLRKRMRTIYRNEKNHYFLTYGPQEVIDGYKKGTKARFANHSCDPNCRIEKWFHYFKFRSVNGEFRVGLYASRDIMPGEEITYDYKFQSFGQMQKCACGGPSCRGYIGLKKGLSPEFMAQEAVWFQTAKSFDYFQVKAPPIIIRKPLSRRNKKREVSEDDSAETVHRTPFSCLSSNPDNVQTRNSKHFANKQ